MVTKIYFQAFNPNLQAYMRDLADDSFTPTLNDRLEKYVHSPEYQRVKSRPHVRIAIILLRFLADLGTLCEIISCKVAWRMLSNEQWLRIVAATAKIIRKSREYRYDSASRDMPCSALE